MGILFWRKNVGKIDAFAHTAADELFSFVSPKDAEWYFGADSSPEKKKKKHLRNVESRVNGVILQMHDFSHEHSLGIYGKARLQKQFSDRLIELGYDAESTRQLVRAILYRKLV